MNFWSEKGIGMLIAPRDLVIVKVNYKEKIGNIIIAETYGGKENVMEYDGEVISVGPECPFKDEIEIGDKILFHRNEGTKIKDSQSNEYISLNPRAILCRI